MSDRSNTPREPANPPEEISEVAKSLTEAALRLETVAKAWDVETRTVQKLLAQSFQRRDAITGLLEALRLVLDRFNRILTLPPLGETVTTLSESEDECQKLELAAFESMSDAVAALLTWAERQGKERQPRVISMPPDGTDAEDIPKPDAANQITFDTPPEELADKQRLEPGPTTHPKPAETEGEVIGHSPPSIIEDSAVAPQASQLLSPDIQEHTADVQSTLKEWYVDVDETEGRKIALSSEEERVSQVLARLRESTAVIRGGFSEDIIELKNLELSDMKFESVLKSIDYLFNELSPAFDAGKADKCRKIIAEQWINFIFPLFYRRLPRAYLMSLAKLSSLSPQKANLAKYFFVILPRHVRTLIHHALDLELIDPPVGSITPDDATIVNKHFTSDPQHPNTVYKTHMPGLRGYGIFVPPLVDVLIGGSG